MSEKTKEAPRSVILWKGVESRHYEEAQKWLKASGKASYSAYIVRLVERLDGAEPKELSKGQIEAIVKAFEEKFGNG